jgi:hypothetical protein
MLIPAESRLDSGYSTWRVKSIDPHLIGPSGVHRTHRHSRIVKQVKLVKIEQSDDLSSPLREGVQAFLEIEVIRRAKWVLRMNELATLLIRFDESFFC